MRHYFASELIKSTAHLLAALEATLEAIDGLSITRDFSQISRNTGSLLVSAQRNTWSRAARRQRGNELQNMEAAAAQESLSPIILVCGIDLAAPEAINNACALVGSWRKGRLRRDFESFWSHTTRKVANALLAAYR